MTDYIVLNSKRYKVADENFKPTFARIRTFEVGQTGKTLITDFTLADKQRQEWKLNLRVYISTVPDDDYGNWTDLLSAYRSTSVAMTMFDESAHIVKISTPLIPYPRVRQDLRGLSYGIFFVPITLQEVHS